MQDYKDWVGRWLDQRGYAGDLARRVYVDKGFPLGGDRKIIGARLKEIGMTVEESVPFYASWKLYIANKDKRVRENVLEKRLVREIELRGGKCWKFVSPGMSGVPDRICILPNGRTVFVEMKAPGKPMQPLQIKRAEELRSLGHKVYCLDSDSAIRVFLREVFDYEEMLT